MLDLRNRPQLIVRLRVLKALFKLLLPRRIRRKRKAGSSFPLGVELNEPRRQIFRRRLCLCLCLLPLVPAELVEPYCLIFSARANILADKVQLRRGNVQHICPLIRDFHVILDCAAHLHLLHADIAADAVVFVDNEIARREVGEGLQLFAVRGRFFGRYFALGFFDEQLPLC